MSTKGIAACLERITQTSAVAVVQEAIEKAKADTTNSILEIIEDRAMARAEAVDSGKLSGPLAGVPFIAKDNMLTFGSRTTAASRLLENFEAPFQAEAVDRLEAAGAICIGKSNLDAFAHGASTENSAFGPTRNPHDETRVAGGSSGGSAASVALGIVPFALGTDTGGSIRQPASFCGVVGLKPTYGSVSRYGVVAMASSTDVIGPLAPTVDDARKVMAVIAGTDAKDSTTIDSPYVTDKRPDVKKIGLVKQWVGDGLDDEVRRSVERSVDDLRSHGYEIEEVSLPSLEFSLAAYYIIVPAEIASNLARYDGVRYGVRGDASSLQALVESTRTGGFMAENKRRILIGNYVLSSGYYEAYFKKAAQVRTLIVQEMSRALGQVDVLVGPTAPTTAFKLGENTEDPLSMYLADQMTVGASLAGLPAVSVPARAQHLPVGLQIVGASGADMTVLDVAEIVERGSHG